MKYYVGTFEIDTTQFQISTANKLIAVEPKVFDLLVYLIENRQRLVSRDELFENIWLDREVSDTTLSNHIKSARKILGDDGDKQEMIKTVRGRGYQFIAKVTSTNSDTNEELVALETQPQLGHFSLAKNRKKYLISFVLFLIIITLGYWQLTAEKTPAQDRPYILVLPFEAIGEEQQKWQPFAEQMTRQVIRELRKIASLHVVPTSSAFTFKQNKNRQYIQEQLPNVRYVLSATINIHGTSQIQVSPELEELKSGKLIWDNRYSSRVDDTTFFSIQTNIATALSKSLNVAINDTEKASLGELPTTNLKAYEFYIAGQNHRDMLTHQSLKKAIELFTQAIKLDPTFEAAYIAKADAYRLIMAYFEKPIEVLPFVIDTVAEALKINPNSAEARSSLGLAYILAWRWQDAWNMLNQANTLDNSIALTQLGFALYYSGIGDVNGVVESLEKADQLDPLNIEIADWGHWALAMVGELNAANKWADNKLQLHPDVGILYSGASVSASLKGEHQRAIKLAKKGIMLDKDASYPLLALAQAYGHAGEVDKIPPLLQQAQASLNYQCPYETAITYLLINNIEETFKQLNLAVNYRSNCLVFTRNDLRLNPIRKDPRFTALLVRLGLDNKSIEKYSRY
ncbi:winged helix-turn-helix domain-containing protein [Colwellia sp. 1_MG-2023]|uniref:winged helix-turn-helix domain-containing protein n=1 Tax=Colwellia sp. 1_MG-2023 TaxID=3062649 RepID=UPI0026E3CF42|nr:winged helix-turn-helix domain-containing protein [Colwellia sp. 1_MG-2023]MDO6446247.1 winged helix-turn-helix domain-containing protein [Colwellia sp. 1_MG-2023]